MPESPDGVRPGVVVTLDTDALRARGDCFTNAEIGPAGDRAVTGTHDFLVVSVHHETGECTAVPLFAKSAVGNQPLAEALKSGAPDGWIGTETYFSRWQHWRMPPVVIAEALAAADGRVRGYAVHDRSALDDIRNWEGRNRAGYRPA